MPMWTFAIRTSGLVVNSEAPLDRAGGLFQTSQDGIDSEKGVSGIVVVAVVADDDEKMGENVGSEEGQTGSTVSTNKPSSLTLLSFFLASIFDEKRTDASSDHLHLDYPRPARAKTPNDAVL